MTLTLKIMSSAADLRGAQIDTLAGHTLIANVVQCEFEPDTLKGIGIATIVREVGEGYRVGSHANERRMWSYVQKTERHEIPSYAYLMNESGKVISQYRSPQTTADWAHACGVRSADEILATNRATQFTINALDAEAFRKSQQVQFTPVEGWNPPPWHAGYFRRGDTVQHDGRYWRAKAPYFYVNHAPAENDLWEELFPISWMTGKVDLPKPVQRGDARGATWAWPSPELPRRAQPGIMRTQLQRLARQTKALADNGNLLDIGLTGAWNALEGNFNALQQARQRPGYDPDQKNRTMTSVKRSWLCALHARLTLDSVVMSLDDQAAIARDIALYLDEK